jgi:hypothetical protein
MEQHIENPFARIYGRLTNIETILLQRETPSQKSLQECPEELLTQDEAAKFLKCTTTSLFRLRKADKIKQYGLGGKRYYKKSELLEALTVVNN